MLCSAHLDIGFSNAYPSKAAFSIEVPATIPRPVNIINLIIRMPARMEGGGSAAAGKASGSPDPGKPPRGETPRRASGEILVEHTDFRKAKNIWQEKLDDAMAKKEQEQILVRGRCTRVVPV